MQHVAFNTLLALKEQYKIYCSKHLLTLKFFINSFKASLSNPV